TFTVTDDPATGQPGRKAPESVVIDAPSYCIETPVSAVQFSADVQPPEAEQGLVWSVRDAASKQQTAKAAVSPSGVLTAVEPAVVEVLAHAAEDASVYDARLVTIRSAADKLSPLWSIESPNAAKYAISGEAATIVSNGGNMYNTGSSMPNIFFAGIPWGAASAGDFSAQVRVSGKPNAGYQEAGLIFYKDQNNYVSALRKNQGGSPRVGAISEANASASEGQYTNDSGFGLGDVMYLRITKTGAVYKSEYSTDGTVWNVMGATGEYTNAALGSDFKIGFYAGNTAGPAITFDDFRVNGAPLPLTSQHNPPSAVGPAIAASGGTLVLSSGYASPDATPEGASVCRWYASGSPDGPFKPVELSDKTIAVAEAIAGQYVKAAIVPIDMDGRTGAPVWTDAVQAPAAGAPNNAGLASLTAANAAFDKQFSPGVTSYAAYAAPGFALTAKAASPGATVTILSGETALASGVGQASAAISPDAGPITVRVDAADGQTSKDYGISVRPLADSDAYLKSLVPDGVSPIAFSPDTQWYTAAASTQNAIQLSLATRSAGAGVKIYVNDELFDSGDSAYSGEIPLFSGLNAIKAVVTAADGMTERFYRLSVLKADNSAWQVRDISIDGETIDGFDPDVRSYELWLARGQNPVLIGATPADPSSSVNISVNGAVTSGLSVNARLEAGWNNATIAIAAANSAKTRTYELKIFLPSDANADITSIDIAGVKLVPAFSPEITSYTAYTGGAEQGFAVTALESGARLKAVINNQTVGGNGQIAGAANLYPGSNVLTVRSVSPDGSATRVYTVDIIRSGFVYVSDLDWESATLGDTNGGKNPAPAKDRGWEGAHRPVNLIGADMTAAEYAKGISTHAASDIVYDVAGKGYAKFVSDYGIEFDVTKKNEPNVRFYVLIDGVVTFTSDVMNYAPYQHVEVDIPPSAQKVTLRVLGVNNIWSAHATWADAKFYFETSQGGTDVSHAITVAPAANGSVAANPQGSVPRNGDAVFSFVPDPGYALKSVTINGDAVAPAPDGTYTVAKVQCDLAVTAVFAPEIDAEIALGRDGGTVAADYTLINLSAGGVEAVCVLAVYDGGRLVDLKTAPAAAGKGAEAQASLQTTAAPGCSVRAYVWRADTYAPICDAATL
ncbi:MAG: cadherin-like beta sandwich domain-containing protein, partial [Oscillospiraceae bacterium]|nr:cadherin-like beta sandwich domain-containing protein [Oscillospiraceae bacterium]